MRNTLITGHETTVKLFAEKLKTARKKAGLTQKELADKAGMHPSVIARYEAGGAMPRQKAIDKLLNAIEVSSETFKPPMYSAKLTIGVNVPLHSLDESILKTMEIKKAIKEIDDAEIEISLVSIREVGVYHAGDL